jgi:hypothetical protein
LGIVLDLNEFAALRAALNNRKHHIGVCRAAVMPGHFNDIFESPMI